MKNMLDYLKVLLEKDERLVSKDQLFKNKINELAIKLDKGLIKLLLSDDKVKETFFVQVDQVLVFDKDKFIRFISNKQFLKDSYTSFSNKIGLTVDDEYLSEKKEVVLSWPYKDCVLEGGMTKEDQKYSEIFWNEILAPDEISRLLDPKVFTNAKRINAAGEHKLDKFKTDGNEGIKDNIIIKGNNLLTLHSLKKRFTGKVKLIYIDPPYNTGNDSFGYNDRFNHSSWLTFMKNRLEVAKDLLSKDGAIFVQIDHHEVGYLNALMDEVFSPENKIQIISVKTSSPAGFKTVNPGPIDVTEYLLFYTKSRKDFKFKRGYTKVDYDENYNLYIENIEDDPSNWTLRSLRDVIYEQNEIKLGKTIHQSNKNAKKKWGEYWKTIRYYVMADFALENAHKVVSVRDPHKPTAKLKKALKKSKAKKDQVFVYRKSEGNEEIEERTKKEAYLYNGGSLSFYSNKIQMVNNEKKPTVLLTDLWTDLDWGGIAKEGGVKLKNGKKPEALIKRIIEITCDKKNDIVLDFFLGSGTTCATAHKLGYQYIGIEQLEYCENDSIVRLKNVINNDQSGISKAANWEGGGDFIYMELAKWNQNLIEKIKEATTKDELKSLWETIKEKGFLSYKINIKTVDENAKELTDLTIEDQKRFLFECLDKNHLYINYSEINDNQYEVNDKDKKINKDFYKD
jgi:adenine-specific DNA-methyltransferase